MSDDKTPRAPSTLEDNSSTLAPSTQSMAENSIAKESGVSTREATRSPSPTPSLSLQEKEEGENEERLALKKTMTAKEAQAELDKTMASGEGIEYPTGTKLGLISMALCLSVFLMALDNTIIATAIPKITDQFKSLADVGWYGSA